MHEVAGGGRLPPRVHVEPDHPGQRCSGPFELARAHRTDRRGHTHREQRQQFALGHRQQVHEHRLRIARQPPRQREPSGRCLHTAQPSGSATPQPDLTSTTPTDKENPTADCSGDHQVDGMTGQTVVGSARAGRSTSSACKRLRHRAAEPIRDSEFASHQKSECTDAIFSSCASKLIAWQTGGVHVRPAIPS